MARKQDRDSLIRELLSLRAKGEDISPKGPNQKRRVFREGSKEFGSTWDFFLAAKLNPSDFGISHRERRRTKEEWIELVRNLYDTGEDVKPSALQKRYPGFQSARKRYFGESSQAVYEAAKIPLEKVGIKPQYSDKDLINKFHSLVDKGEDPSYTNMASKHPKLTQNLRRRLGGGSWYRTLERLGMSYEKIRRQHAPRSRDELISWLKEREEEGFWLSSKNVKAQFPDMYSAIQKHFPGGFYVGLRAAEVDPSKYWKFEPDLAKRRQAKPPGTWTPDFTLERLRDRSRQNKNMSEKAIRDGDYPLYKACYRNFGGVYPALQKIGIDPSEWRLAESKGYWSENPQGRVIDRIKMLAAREGIEGLSARRAYLEHGGLYDAALKYFPRGWEEAVSRAGFDYKSIRKQREPYTQNELLDTLRRLQTEGLSLDWTTIRSYDANLAAGIINRFGKYKNAVEAMHIDYDDVCRNRLLQNFKGIAFQSLVEEALKALGRSIANQQRFLSKGRKALVPDFVDTESGEWIDAKLSSLTPDVAKSIDKYLERVDHLTIIYLNKTRMRNERKLYEGFVAFRPIKEFYPDLKERGQDDLIARFEMLRKGIYLHADLQRKLDDYLASQSAPNRTQILRAIEKRK